MKKNIEIIPLDEFIQEVLYYVSERDDRGLLKGEKAPKLHEETGLPIWRAYVYDGSKHLHWLRGNSPSGYLEEYSQERPKDNGPVKWESVIRVGEGKPLQLGPARMLTGWPQATVEQLSDTKALEARYYEYLENLEDKKEVIG